jgi:histidine triad (HIT) family protein
MAVKTDCIFCKLGAGKSKKFYEDNECFVVPDKYPSQYGHLLVVSKEHYDNLLVTPDNVISCMYSVAKKYGNLLKDRLHADGIVVATNIGRESGQIIFHTHIHVIPKYGKKLEGFMPHKELTDEEADKLMERLKG